MADVGKAQDIQHEECAPPTIQQMAELKGSYEVDTVHNDEALKVLANYNGEESWNQVEETKLRRKIDRRLLPILCITYALQYYDKGTMCPSRLSCLFWCCPMLHFSRLIDLRDDIARSKFLNLVCQILAQSDLGRRSLVSSKTWT